MSVRDDQLDTLKVGGKDYIRSHAPTNALTCSRSTA